MFILGKKNEFFCIAPETLRGWRRPWLLLIYQKPSNFSKAKKVKLMINIEMRRVKRLEQHSPI